MSFLFFVFFIPFSVAQLVPQVTNSTLLTRGTCIVFTTDLLGNANQADEFGLVATHLSIEAATELPFVRILRSVVTCQVLKPQKNKFTEVAVLVQFQCSGAACSTERPLATLVYTHLFTFYCDPGFNRYTTYNTITGLPPVSFRDGIKTIDSIVPARLGQCVTCSSDQTLVIAPASRGRFDIETGCFGKTLT